MPDPEYIEFTFRVPKAAVKILELAEGKMAETLLDEHFKDYWFCKTHHEADMVVKGKSRIPQTTMNLKHAKECQKIMYADAQEYSDEELGVAPADRNRINELRKVVKVKPQPPRLHGGMGKKSNFKKEGWYLDLLKNKNEDPELRKMSEKAWLREEIAKVEGRPEMVVDGVKKPAIPPSKEYADYKTAMEVWTAAKDELDGLAKGYREKHAQKVREMKYSPNVKRKK